MPLKSKVIITCAVTGSIMRRTSSLPSSTVRGSPEARSRPRTRVVSSVASGQTAPTCGDEALGLEVRD